MICEDRRERDSKKNQKHKTKQKQTWQLTHSPISAFRNSDGKTNKKRQLMRRTKWMRLQVQTDLAQQMTTQHKIITKINVVQKWLWKTMAKSGTSDTEYLERNNNEDTLVSGSPWENTQTH